MADQSSCCPGNTNMNMPKRVDEAGRQKNVIGWDSPVVQWLRRHAPNAGAPGSIPGQGTRTRMPQLRPGAAK